MLPERKLIEQLADGRFHTGAELRAALGLGRRALARQLRGLAGLCADLQATPGHGYRLTEPRELLDRDAILGLLDSRSRPLLSDLDIFLSLDSTSDYLGERTGERAPSGYACLSEHQRLGRGRRGRRWVSPFGVNLYLSMLWRFPSSPRALAGLSLAAGVALVRALEEAGVAGAGLKWPNDVVFDGRKLAGVLVEIGGEPSGPCHAVVGIGVNVRMPARYGTAIDQAWTDVYNACGAPVSRNRLAGRLLHHLLLALQSFRERGLSPFARDWARLDTLRGKTVAVQWPGGETTGVAEGIGPQGEIIIAEGAVRRAYACGEVSLRLGA